MLDFDLSTSVRDKIWKQTTAQASLPCTEAAYFARTGLGVECHSTRRQYRRVQVSGRGAVDRDGELLGVYAIDISPASAGFYCPVQLFPREQVTLWFEEYGQLQLVIRRCRRLKPSCYACGGYFLDGAMPPAAYSELLRCLRE